MPGSAVSLCLSFTMTGLGLAGLLASRNIIRLIVSQQVMSKGALVALMLAGAASGHAGLAESLAVSFVFVDTATAVVALALAIQVQRRFGTLDLRELARLKG